MLGGTHAVEENRVSAETDYAAVTWADAHSLSYALTTGKEGFPCPSFSTVASPEVLQEEDLRAESLQKLLLTVCGEERGVREKEKLAHICQEAGAKRIYVKSLVFFGSFERSHKK